MAIADLDRYRGAHLRIVDSPSDEAYSFSDASFQLQLFRFQMDVINTLIWNHNETVYNKKLRKYEKQQKIERPRMNAAARMEFESRGVVFEPKRHTTNTGDINRNVLAHDIELREKGIKLNKPIR